MQIPSDDERTKFHVWISHSSREILLMLYEPSYIRDKKEDKKSISVQAARSEIL